MDLIREQMDPHSYYLVKSCCNFHAENNLSDGWPLKITNCR